MVFDWWDIFKPVTKLTSSLAFIVLLLQSNHIHATDLNPDPNPKNVTDPNSGTDINSGTDSSQSAKLDICENLQDENLQEREHPPIFGANLFQGNFSSGSRSTLNSDYIIDYSDRIQVRMWGTYEYEASLMVDSQGNITLPNVPPIKVVGLKNSELQQVVKEAVDQTYRSSVGVYASLEALRPIKIFVTGFVNEPGYYAGLTTDSILAYIDRAGGVDPKRGSYIGIGVKRSGKLVHQVNLYDFLLAGRYEPFVLADDDVVIVAPQKKTFSIAGDVRNAYTFEFNVDTLTAADALAVANPLADATHVCIKRSLDAASADVFTLDNAQTVPIQNGDSLFVSSTK